MRWRDQELYPECLLGPVPPLFWHDSRVQNKQIRTPSWISHYMLNVHNRGHEITDAEVTVIAVSLKE